MKNLKTIGLSILLTVATSCHKDDPTPTPTPVAPTCGCDTSATIETKTNITGVLKKNSGNFRLYGTSENYYIHIIIGGSTDRYYLICNDTILNGITIPENVAINVTFSGIVKEYCAPTDIIFLYTTQNIKLTEIHQ